MAVIDASAQALTSRMPRLPAALFAAVAGWFVSVVVLFPLGLGARATGHDIDRPVHRWITAHAAAPSSTTQRAVSHLTTMGDRDPAQVVALVAAVLLAVAYRRRWWIPVVAVLAAVLMQRQAQLVLTDLVPRAAPPAVHAGVFPSGGVSRVFAVYGMIVLLAIALLPPALRRWRVGAVVGVVLLSVLEGFTRLYLSQHWLTDALSGLVLGGLLLLAEGVVVHVLTDSGHGR